MALSGLIRIGVEHAIERGRDELASIATGANLPEEAAEHLAQALRAIPALMVDVDRALSHEGAPPQARVLWLVAIGYLLLDEDLAPSRAGDPVRGVLDDAYFLHRVAQELRAHLPPLDARSLDGGAALLRSVLPSGVAAEIDRRIAAARERATELSR